MPEPLPREQMHVPERHLRVPERPISAERLHAGRRRWHEAPAMSERTAGQWWGNVRMRWNHHTHALAGSRLSYHDTLDILAFGRTPAFGGTRLELIDQVRGHDHLVGKVARSRHGLYVGDLHAARNARTDGTTLPTTLPLIRPQDPGWPT